MTQVGSAFRKSLHPRLGSSGVSVTAVGEQRARGTPVAESKAAGPRGGAVPEVAGPAARERSTKRPDVAEAVASLSPRILVAEQLGWL